MFSQASFCSQGEGIPGPKSFPGGGYLWSQVPSGSGWVCLVPDPFLEGGYVGGGGGLVCPGSGSPPDMYQRGWVSSPCY